MRIAFLETLGWDMNVETPFLRPLGGTQSAACYLAITMATAGHEVFFVSVNGSPGGGRGGNCLPFGVLGGGGVGRFGGGCCGGWVWGVWGGAGGGGSWGRK